MTNARSSIWSSVVGTTVVLATAGVIASSVNKDDEHVARLEVQWNTVKGGCDTGKIHIRYSERYSGDRKGDSGTNNRSIQVVPTPPPVVQKHEKTAIPGQEKWLHVIPKYNGEPLFVDAVEKGGKHNCQLFVSIFTDDQSSPVRSANNLPHFGAAAVYWP